MSFTPPKPIWVNSSGKTAQTAINADGFSGYAGLGGMTEVPESGQADLEWAYKFTMVLEGPASQYYTNAGSGYYDRGYIYSGWIINNTKVTPMRGAKRRVEIFWQNIDGYLPPDEWDVRAEDMQPHLERHPMFISLTREDFQTIRLAFNAATPPAVLAAMNQVDAISNPALGQLLYDKMVGGMENYYLAGARYTWSTYFFADEVPSLSVGGVQYTNPGGPSGYILPDGYNWLRYADEVGQANYCPLGGIIKLTSTWIGAPNGFWDLDIYPLV